MSIVRIVDQVSYDEDLLKEKLTEVLDWVNLKEVQDKKILIFFDYSTPNLLILKTLFSLLKSNGAKSIEFGTSVMTKMQKNLISEIEKQGFILHDFRNEPYEEFGVDLKSKKSQHFFGYQVLSPSQYQTEKAFENSDIFKVRTLKKIFIPESIASSDYIIPVIKLKDSPINKIGGFINSLLYMVPTNVRSEIFLKALSLKFTDALLDVYGVIKNSILFGLVDGIVGDLTKTDDDNFGVLFSSNDLLSLDSVISVLIGFRSSDIESNKLGSIYDLGHGLLKEVVIDGEDFIKLRKELTKKLKFKKYFDKKIHPQLINQDKEIESISIFCPTGAIENKNSQYSINKSKCIKCNFCVELAPSAFDV